MTDKKPYENYAGAVVNEISTVLGKVNPQEIEVLMDEIVKAEKIFIIGLGRVFLSLQCLAKRLAHFGFDVNVVGSVVEKSITERDLLLVASGSGESRVPLNIAQIASKYNPQIGLITSAKESSIKKISHFAVHLPTPTKVDMSFGVQSIQSMSTLFDQCLHIFGDIMCLMLQQKTGQSNEDLAKRHANLE